MLSRVLEPEVMDTQQDADEYADIDNTTVNDEFVSDALRLAPPSGTALDLGTGPGDIAVLLAQRHAGLRVVAVDLGRHMVALARDNVKRAGLEARVRIVCADAKATGDQDATFDMVISNSLVHHIPDPVVLFKEACRVASRAAALFIKDLHRPGSEAEHQALVNRYAKECTDHQRRLFSDSLRAALTVEEVRAICDRVGLTDVDVCRTSDRHWCVKRPWSAGVALRN